MQHIKQQYNITHIKKETTRPAPILFSVQNMHPTIIINQISIAYRLQFCNKSSMGSDS